MDPVVDGGPTRERALRLGQDVFGSAGTDASAQRSRWPVLRRHLLAGDAIALSAGAIVGATVAGTSAIEGAACAASLTLCWILVGWVLGVYAGDDLRAWATGVPTTPRVVITALTVVWPYYALLSALGD